MPVDELDRDLRRYPKLARLLDLWNQKRGARAMPARRDIDAVELREWLGSLILVEAADAGGTYRYRVYGTNLTDLFGHELTGKVVSRFASARESLIVGDYERIRRDRMPVYFDRPAVVRGELMRVRILALPLSANGAEVDMILAAVYPSSEGRRPRRQAPGRPGEG